MSASKCLIERGAVEGGSSDLSGHQPTSFASRMARMAIDQGRDKETRTIAKSNVWEGAPKSGDNQEALFKAEFSTKVGGRGSSQFAASSDVAGRSKRLGGPRECHRDLSGHHPLSFASRKATMGAKRERIPERPALKTFAQEVIIPDLSPSAALPQDVLPNVDIEPQPQVDEVVLVEPEHRFKNPAPFRLPASVVLGASRSFTGTVSDARSVVRLVDFDDLPDSIGLVAELCAVSDDNEMDRGGHPTS